MITKEQFSTLVQEAHFFGNIGSATPRNGVLIISSLAPWGDENNASDQDNRIAEQMDWLPTTKDQSDPFYPLSLDGMATNESILKEAKNYRMDVYKIVLTKLRATDLRQLRSGANNFEEAAKGALLYALRNAATEIVLGVEGKWFEIAKFYFEGNWPCGITQKGELIII